jgi:hypothetical protein
MSHKATIYPDILSLMKAYEAMRKRTECLRATRTELHNTKKMLKYEEQLRVLQHGWVEKLERVLRNIVEDIECDSIDLRKYAEKVLESKPKSVL